MREEALKYWVSYDQVLLADSVRQKGFRHEYKIAGKSTPLVVYSKNPESNLKERHYPTTGITLGVTAVKEERPGHVPLLKLYNSSDPVVVQSEHGPNPIAANYTATLAVLNSRARKVAGALPHHSCDRTIQDLLPAFISFIPTMLTRFRSFLFMA